MKTQGENINRLLIPTATQNIILLLSLALTATGCMSVKETVYLQEIDARGFVTEPPIHITDDNKSHQVHISPRISVNTKEEMNGDIEGSGPYKTTTQNFGWSIPSFNAALDGDVKISSSFAFNAGINYSVHNNEGFWGGNAGLGLLFSGEDIAGRLEGGVNLQSFSYTAQSVVVTETQDWFSSSTTQTVRYFDDNGSCQTLSLYGALTLNTKSQQSLVNGYLQFAVGRQKFADFHPTRERIILPIPLVDYTFIDARVQSSSTFIMISPGLYFNLTPTLRLLTGARFVWETEIADTSPNALIMPMVQCEFAL